jgi:hypothetical protein
MNLGQLDPENEEFINNYKEMGYTTKTQLANEAIKNLRLLKAQQMREEWRRQAYDELKGLKPNVVLKELDGVDFVKDKTW